MRPVVPLLIAVNVGVFLMSHPLLGFDRDFMSDHFAISWAALTEGRWWTLVTSVFSHGHLLHLLFNMIVLQSFGGLMERVLGSFRFLRFYLVAGIFASFAHAWVSAFYIGDPDLRAVGASGALAGVVWVFSLLFPREKILLFGLIPVPALIGALLFVGLDIWGLTAQAGGGGLPIGHGAHLGGSLAGICYYIFFLRARRT